MSPCSHFSDCRVNFERPSITGFGYRPYDPKLLSRASGNDDGSTKAACVASRTISLDHGKYRLRYADGHLDGKATSSGPGLCEGCFTKLLLRCVCITLELVSIETVDLR